MLENLLNSGLATMLFIFIFVIHLGIGITAGARWSVFGLVCGVLVPWVVYLAIVGSAFFKPNPTEGDRWAVGAGLSLVGLAGSGVWLMLGAPGTLIGLAIRWIWGKASPPKA